MSEPTSEFTDQVIIAGLRSEIDELTNERDELKAKLMKFGVEATNKINALEIRAEKAEAKAKRLEEALIAIVDWRNNMGSFTRLDEDLIPKAINAISQK